MCRFWLSQYTVTSLVCPFSCVHPAFSCLCITLCIGIIPLLYFRLYNTHPQNPVVNKKNTSKIWMEHVTFFSGPTNVLEHPLLCSHCGDHCPRSYQIALFTTAEFPFQCQTHMCDSLSLFPPEHTFPGGQWWGPLSSHPWLPYSAVISWYFSF